MSMTPRIKIILAGILCLLFVLYLALSAGQRVGKTEVNIQVAPDDAIVLVNGIEYDTGTVRLKPGEYEFVAKRTGFKDDRQQVTVGHDPVDVILIPSPDSAEAYDYLRENPDVQTAREELGGKRANLKGLELKASAPIISLLPYTDLTGPFTIDYGPSDTQPNGVVLIVSNSSPEGRANAVRWIKQQGYNPADLEIIFDDFVNPLTQNTEELSNAD